MWRAFVEDLDRGGGARQDEVPVAVGQEEGTRGHRERDESSGPDVPGGCFEASTRGASGSPGARFGRRNLKDVVLAGARDGERSHEGHRRGCDQLPAGVQTKMDGQMKVAVFGRSGLGEVWRGTGVFDVSRCCERVVLDAFADLTADPVGDRGEWRGGPKVPGVPRALSPDSICWWGRVWPMIRYAPSPGSTGIVRSCLPAL